MLWTTHRTGRLLATVVSFAIVAALVVAGVQPARAVIDTPTACPDEIDSAGFTDLAGLSSSARNAIDCLAEYGISQGTTPTTFSPWDDVPRWQMALFLARQAETHGIDMPSGTSVGFTDIGELSTAAQRAINQLQRLGITEGTTSTTFSPNDLVPRWQMALFIIRLLEEVEMNLPNGSDQDFSDVRVLPSATERAINQLIQLDISEGTSGRTFTPNQFVSRWQMALFLTRTLEADDIEPPEGVITTRSATPRVGAPDLESVSFDDEDSDETQLRYRFDEEIVADIDEGHIWLVGWNGQLINPHDSGKGDGGDTVEAVFWTEDYDNAVAGAVTSGAVYDVDNLDNTMGSAGIQSVTVDGIDWPDDYPELVDVGEFESADETVEFEFDQEVDVIGSAGAFVLIEQDGTVHTGDAYSEDEVENDDDETITIVTVEFDGILDSEWRDVVRAYVDEAAVEETDGLLQNFLMAVDVSGSGRTDTPYITDVDLSDADEGIVVFEFNDDLDDINTVGSTDFVLVYHDGSMETAGTADRVDTDKNEVEVDYGSLASDIVVYATVLAGAVEESGGDPNNVDTYAMTYKFDAGDTAGPDLVSSEGSGTGLGDDNYTIVLEFDEDVDDTVAEFTFDPDTDLLAWDEEGELVTLSGGEVTIDDDTIEIEFEDPDPGVEELSDGDVVRLGVYADTIADAFGFVSYPDGVGLDANK
jgi:hypothetical protein